MFALIATAICFTLFGLVAGLLIARSADDERIRQSCDAQWAAAVVTGFQEGCWYCLKEPHNAGDWRYDVYMKMEHPPDSYTPLSGKYSDIAGEEAEKWISDTSTGS